MHESTGLKPDWLSDIKLFSVKISNILWYSNLSRIFPLMGSNDIGRYVLNICLSPLVWIGTTFAFFHSLGNLPLSTQDWKINLIGLQIQ